MRLSLTLTALLGCSWIALFPHTLYAATVSGDCTEKNLQDAIAAAQPNETITFNCRPNHTINLSQPLVLNQAITLNGQSAQNLALSGGRKTRLLDVQEGVNVKIQNLTLKDGNANGTGFNGSGGAIRTGTRAQLTVENVTFTNNNANGSGGGAIFGGHRSVNTILNSRFENNRTAANEDGGKGERGGGAIAIASEGRTTIRNSTFLNNKGLNGGAVNTLLGALTIENSTFTGNDSTAGGAQRSPFGYSLGYGGAVYTDGASATPNASTQGQIQISNSRFENNRGAGQGGGLFLFGYPGDRITVRNSTILKNQVQPSGDRASLGGGIRHGGGASLTLNNVMIADNQAHQQGGGLWSGEESAITMDRVTFWGNKAIAPDRSVSLGGAMLLAGNGKVEIQRTTIAYNQAGFQGGGVWGGGGNTRLTRVVAVGNRGGANSNGYNVHHHTGTTFNSGGNNFQDPEPNPNDTKLTRDVQMLAPRLVWQDTGRSVPEHPCISEGAIASRGAGSGERCGASGTR